MDEANHTYMFGVGDLTRPGITPEPLRRDALVAHPDEPSLLALSSAVEKAASTPVPEPYRRRAPPPPRS
ncbi:hypothetical protein AB0H71_05495 [Nocardia sp. NPDC050697]|uniref:hypothetical protein n=1 Tax=Nocardia sp. NPDC050697 TaxID=3155158 RepID=UPI0033E955CB